RNPPVRVRVLTPSRSIRQDRPPVIRILSTLERPPLIAPPDSTASIQTVSAGAGRWWRVFGTTVRRGGAYDAIVLDGSVGIRGGYADRLATALTRVRPRPPRI